MATSNSNIYSMVHEYGSQWVQLKSGKEFSRLLYPNPVCVLCTTRSEKNNNDVKEDNVMVLSWLTPTNNEGRFMFSINKSRYSASLLAPSLSDTNITTADERCGDKRTYSQTETDANGGSNIYANNYQVGIEFSLSIPVQGMEQMVLDVGSISGRFGTKFPSTKQSKQDSSTIDEMHDYTQIEQLSNRQRKKQRKQQLSIHGVEGLVRVPLGYSEKNHDTESQSSLFAIKGTNAHLKCRTYAVIGSTMDESIKERVDVSEENGTLPSIIDDNHLLIMAEVIDAYVHQLYWDDKKLIFRPLSSDVPSYLTFFGSQTFGYVTSGDNERTSASVD